VFAPSDSTEGSTDNKSPDSLFFSSGSKEEGIYIEFLAPLKRKRGIVSNERSIRKRFGILYAVTIFWCELHSDIVRV